jgi:Flp pilus assembly secretin CpaC
MSLRNFVYAAVIAACLAPAAMAEPFRVNVDRSVTMRLSAPAASVILGNATVADVQVYDANTLLITGKAFGSTNLTVLDARGNVVMTTELVVVSESPGQLTVTRGTGTQSYSCVERCRSTPMVGDSPEYFNGVMQTVTGKAAAARGQ